MLAKKIVQVILYGVTLNVGGKGRLVIGISMMKGED
jgi:hypothetical protein